jgi:hypothetical protein
MNEQPRTSFSCAVLQKAEKFLALKKVPYFPPKCQEIRTSCSARKKRQDSSGLRFRVDYLLSRIQDFQKSLDPDFLAQNAGEESF